MFAARRRNTLADRSIVTLGLASSSIPDFVSGVTLQYFIGVKLGWFPVLALAPQGSEPPHRSSTTCMLPALALVVVYFGYIARMTQGRHDPGPRRRLHPHRRDEGPAATAGARAATCMRNALQPTVSVIGVQIGYMFSGLIALELIFNYPGLGQPDLQRRVEQGLPAPVGRRDPRRHHLHALHAGRRPRHRLDEPAGPAGGERRMSMNVPPPEPTSAAAIVEAQAEDAVLEELGAEVDAGGGADRHAGRAPPGPQGAAGGCCCAGPGFIVGVLILLFWIVCAIGGDRITPYDPINEFAPPSQPPERRPPRWAPTSSGATCCRG